ncbi:MAG: helix-hairpin-helix domain-containing protein [Syntrophorhabdales bacterium]|jgi:competence ComEA-like helix-hairpin-helix protein
MIRKSVLLVALAALLFTLAAGFSAAEDKLKGKTVNINKATAEDLIKNVPLMTPELAKAIVKYRKDNGDFQTVEELLQVPGMNRTLLKKIKPFFILEGIGGKDCTC